MTTYLPHIAVTKETIRLTDQQVDDMINAVQRQVSFHFRPSWDANATLQYYPEGALIPSGPHIWTCHLLDQSDMPGAGGYHDDQGGTPILKVFCADLEQAGDSISVAFSHEVLEALADPHIQRAIQIADQTFYALEVCDACEADQYAYTIRLASGALISVSDFVTEAWFTGDPGPYDYMSHINRPRQLLTGGYIGEWSPTSGWTQKIADETAAASHRLQARHEAYGGKGAVPRT